MANKLLTTTQAAKKLGVHPDTVRRLCVTGQIKCINISGPQDRPTWRIPQAEVERLLRAGV